ncbi:hypothetical protein Tco_0046601, partial [Tanacetum coccineum]
DHCAAHHSSKAPTDLKPQKKRIPPSSKLKSSYKVRVILPKKQVTKTQHAEETVVIVDATQSLKDSESVEDQGMILKGSKRLMFDPKNSRLSRPNVHKEVKESGLESIRDVTFDQIMDEIDQKNKAAQEKPESPSVRPLYYLHEELSTLNTKVDQLESNISKKVTDDIQSFAPSIVADNLKANLLVFKEANADGEKWEKNNPETPTEEKDAQNPDQTQGEQHSRDATITNAQGEQPPAQELSNVEQDPLVNKENALVLHALVEKSSEVNTSEKKVTNDEPSVKKLKFLIPTSSSIPSPTPLNSIMPKPIQKLNATKMIIEQFTKHLNKTTSSIFSHTPPREPTPPRDPTPLSDESKRKGIATEEPLKEIMPYIEESEDVVVNGLHRNLLPPPGVKGRKGLVIKELESGIFYYYGNFDLVFQKEEELYLATIAQLIRLQDSIQRGTQEAEEMFKKMKLIIEARNDVDQARKIVQDNLDGLGQDM